jgi:hypothetical protein
MLLIKYLGAADKSNISTIRSKYEHLLSRGENVVWYGDRLDPKDSGAVLIQRRLANGTYEVTFVDGHEQQVNSEELIELLTKMLQKKTK